MSGWLGHKNLHLCGSYEPQSQKKNKSFMLQAICPPQDKHIHFIDLESHPSTGQGILKYSPPRNEAANECSNEDIMKMKLVVKEKRVKRTSQEKKTTVSN